MAVYKIVNYGDPILKEKAKPVKEVNESVRRLLDNLRDTMYEARGLGLAAPQIGVPKRAIVVDAGERLYELVNPEIEEGEGEQIDTEACLSIPGVRGTVKRFERVVVKGLNREGEKVRIQATGLLARVFQHEIDHLNGILFVDRAETVIKG